ncbi:hypothetical protein Tco_0980032 [Tanacetum coccineum]
MNHQTSSVPQIAYPSPQVTTQPMTESPLMDLSFVVPVFSPGDDPIACLNKAMAFLTVVASSRFPSTNNQLRTSLNPRNHATIQDGRVTVQQVQGRQGQSYSGTGYKSNATSSGGKQYKRTGKDPRVPDGQAVQTIIPNTAAFQTEDLDTYDSDCDDISNAQAKLMANISNYGSDVISEEKANKEQNNESVTAELEIYKERVKTFEQRLNINLSSREKMIDSQMDDMIREKLALKEQVDSLEQNISKQIKEKECLLQTFTVFKNESKEKEDKYMENKIDLEKKIKKLDNILFKVGQSAQTVHMLTKPQAFYDNIHKQALGYQHPFHLKKAHRIKPTLYDGIVMSDKHVVMHVIDDEETLILEEESRSKMSEKAKDPEVVNKNISHKPIDYEILNRLTNDFGKRFTPQQELSAEQAFWLRMSDPTTKPSDALPVKIEAPKELPKIILVNESLKKLKFHLAKFDNVVKIRTTHDARTEDLLNEIMEVKTVFDQMDAVVQQSSVDKQCLEIAKKELLLENDRLLQQIMSQDVLLTVFKEQFDSIKKTRVRSKEQSDSLIDKLNFKSTKNEDLKAQIQDKVFVITSLKNDLQKLKGKEIVDIAAQIPSATTIVPGMFKLDLEPLAPSTDIAKISRKRSKPDNHGHGNGIESAKAGRMLSKGQQKSTFGQPK